jgi:hypothetical protein
MALKTKQTIVTKQQAITELLEKVHDWDRDCLIGFVQEELEKHYNKLSLKNLEHDYNFEVMGIDAIADEDTPFVKVINTKSSRLLIDGVKK